VTCVNATVFAGVLWNGFHNEVSQKHRKHARKSISSGEVFPKIIREAQSDLKTHFNALKYVFYRYKTR